MHIVFPVFAALASLPTLVSAVRLPVSPQTSLQGRQKAREVYQRRQANSAGILRRLKEGPRKRQSVVIMPVPLPLFSQPSIDRYAYSSTPAGHPRSFVPTPAADPTSSR